MKILLVDDEPMVLESTGKLLESLGYDVHLVSRWDEALLAIRTLRPDVILQDVRMPGLDLPSFVRALRADPVAGRVPIVLCSASMDLDEVAALVGADDFLEKPYRPEDIVSKLEAAAQGKPQAGPSAMAR